MIADPSDKVVERLAPPIPLELLEFGLPATLRARTGDARLRHVPRSPDGGVIADYGGAVEDPGRPRGALSATPGVVDHGLFPPELVAEIFVARGHAVERITLRP